ncbi:MAG: hypothetical protein K2P93_01215 [Alphaproteobacteria bacterium]|nr:hypothetical protein [Alphaproteobacteria bacterium]
MDYIRDRIISVRPIVIFTLIFIFFLNFSSYSMQEEDSQAFHVFPIQPSVDSNEASSSSHRVYTSFYEMLDKTEKHNLRPPLSVTSFEELIGTFEVIEHEGILQNLYWKSLLSEYYSPTMDFTLIRTALLRSSQFQAVEMKAKQIAKVGFCLSEHDKEEGGWLATCIYHSLFWQGYNDNNVIDWLIRKRFYLAKLLRDMENPFDPIEVSANIPLRNTATILEDIVLTIRELHQYMKVLWETQSRNDVELYMDQFLTDLRNVTNQAPNGGQDPLLLHLSKELSSHQKVNGISSVLGRVGELNFQTIGGKTMFSIEAIKDGIYSFCNNRLITLYGELLNGGTRLFILLWQKNMPWLQGLYPNSEAQLYGQAQYCYKREFGETYQDLPQLIFYLPPRNVDMENNSPFNGENNYGRFLSNDPYSVENAETNWGTVAAELSDSLIAYQLAKTWINSRHNQAQEKAKYWFNKYKEFAPTLPFGDFTSLKPDTNEI